MAKESKKRKTAGIVAHRWVKGGPSPNPAGRPKASSTLLKELRDVLNERDPKSKQGMTNLQTIARKMVALAAAGSIRATAEILDRLHGKAPQSIALTGSLETPREERVEGILQKLEMLKADGKSPRVD